MTEQEQELLRRYQEGLCTEKEMQMVEAWYAAWNKDEHVRLSEGELEEAEKLMRAAVFRNMPVKRIRLWPRIAAAAVVILGVGSIAYFAIRKPISSTAIAKADVAPFTQQAILKTGHGKTIVLSGNVQATLASYANTQINKNSNDHIAYTGKANESNQAIFDTLQVPAGGRPYHLKLADGSEVILNVASSVCYPENFRINKSNNKLELLSGEAYFTIVHNQTSKLLLKAKGQVIEDIGTEFNVNTYNDEPVSRTTLINGAVSVNQEKLKPGQQAIINGAHLTVALANLAQTVAWKDGLFRFKGAHIDVIMRELARWYNIDVRYEGKVTDEVFYARVKRSRNISEVLKILESSEKVHFKIEGRRVTVLSKS